MAAPTSSIRRLSRIIASQSDARCQFIQGTIRMNKEEKPAIRIPASMNTSFFSSIKEPGYLVHSGVHVKSIDKKTHSDHHYSAVQKRTSPVWQGVVQKPGYRDEKYRGKTDPQQTENKNNKHFIVHTLARYSCPM